MNHRSLLEFGIILIIVFGTRYGLRFFGIENNTLEWGLAIPLCIVAFIVMQVISKKKEEEKNE